MAYNQARANIRNFCCPMTVEEIQRELEVNTQLTEDYQSLDNQGWQERGEYLQECLDEAIQERDQR